MKQSPKAFSDQHLITISRRLAKTLNSRSSAAGRASIFVPADDLRDALTDPDVEAIEVDRLTGRVLSCVRVRDMEEQLGKLQRRSER